MNAYYARVQSDFEIRITFFHSELGNIHSFKDNGAVAKYAGLVWRESQSGNFRAEDTAMSKAGNTYLRYYLLEATNSVIRHEPSFKKYHDRKFEEVKIHKHQRALALTARKFVRLIYGLGEFFSLPQLVCQLKMIDLL